MEILWISKFLLAVFGAGYTPSTSQPKCAEYRNNATVNDSTSQRNFPSMVTIYANNSNNEEFQNGILISDKFVLSTASGLPESSNLVVVLKIEAIEIAKTYEVIKTIVHPDFNGLSFNVKLFKLNESVPFDDYVRPACLPPNDLSIPKNAIQIGWDARSSHTNNSLYEIESSVISEESCKTLFESSGQNIFVSDIRNGTIFCATPKNGKRQMCNDNVGSALIGADSSNSDTIIGLASYNFKCDNNSATVFVRVSAIIDWIESIVWSEDMPHTTPEITPDETKPEISNYSVNYDPTTPEMQDAVNTSNTILYLIVVVINLVILVILMSFFACALYFMQRKY